MGETVILMRVQKKDVKQKDERKDVTMVEHTLLNYINDMGWSRKHTVKAVNKPGATSEKIFDELDDVIKVKPFRQ